MYTHHLEGCRVLELIPADTGWEAQYTLNRSPIHHRAAKKRQITIHMINKNRCQSRKVCLGISFYSLLALNYVFVSLGPQVQCWGGPDHRLQDPEHPLPSYQEPQRWGKTIHATYCVIQSWYENHWASLLGSRLIKIGLWVGEIIYCS